MNFISSGLESIKRDLQKKSNLWIIYSLLYVDPSLYKPVSPISRLSSFYGIPEFEVSQLLEKLKDLYEGEEIDMEREAYMCFIMSRIFNITLGESAIWLFTHKSHKNGKI